MHFSRISMAIALLSVLASALPLNDLAYSQHTDAVAKRAQAYGQHIDDEEDVTAKRAQAYGQHTDDDDDVVVKRAQAYGQHTDDDDDAVSKRAQ